MSDGHKGRLKIYLGYAAGVGKTYRMLDESEALRQKGVDIVIGYFEPHGRKETIAKTEGLETVPRRILTYAAPSRRWIPMPFCGANPQVTIVDVAHTNVPGAERLKRWQDVHTLLEAGIDVVTTMNVQHLESLNDQVWHSTGVRVRETVPDWVVDDADELVLIDLTPRALRNRLERGVVYPQGKGAARALNFFRRSESHRPPRNGHAPHCS